MSHPPDSGQGSLPAYIPSLDGIRGFAVLLVVVTHTGYTFASGALGVNVFFFLSGFLIASLMRREYRVTGTVSLRKFYARRILRIFPPMYIVLAAATLASTLGLLAPKVGITIILAQFLHLTNYVHVTGSRVLPGTEILWSLSVEEHYYLIFPVLFVFIQRFTRRSQVTFIAGLCLLVLLWRVVVVLSDPATGPAWAYEASDTRMDSILWGAALAMFANPYFEPEVAEKVDRAWLGILALAVLLASQVVREYWYSHTFRYTLQCMCFGPLFVIAIRRAHVFPVALLNLAPLRWIGTISYSLYLYHYLVIAILVQHSSLRGAALLAATLAISLPLCELTARFIERPSARLRKRLVS
jgi:peptidoglycan/LPS O-acetylase OafA/YrhL